MIYVIFVIMVAFGTGMLIGTRVADNHCHPARVEQTILPPEAEDVI